MSSVRRCELGRMIGAALWQKRHALGLDLEAVAARSNLRPLQLLTIELIGTDGPELEQIAAALGLDPDLIIAQASGALLRCASPYEDVIVSPDPDSDGFPF